MGHPGDCSIPVSVSLEVICLTFCTHDQTAAVVLSILSIIFFRKTNCSVLYDVLNFYTVISTLRRAVLTVLWIRFCNTGPIYLFKM